MSDRDPDPATFPVSVLEQPRRQRRWYRYVFADETRVSVLAYDQDSNTRLWVRQQLARAYDIPLREVPDIVTVVGNIRKPDPPQSQMTIDELKEDDGDQKQDCGSDPEDEASTE